MKSSKSISDIFEFILYFFVFFPYISIVSFPSDTQPYAALISTFILIITINLNKVNKNVFYTILLTLFSLVFFVIELNVNAFRDFFGFYSFTVITYASLYIFRHKGFNQKLFRYFSIFWILIGIIQLFVKREFLTFLLADSRTDSLRGVTSLAVEPSYFGIILIFFILLEILTTHKRKWIIIYSFSLIFLTQSAMAVLYLLVFASIYFMIYNKKLFFIAFLILSIFLIIISNIQTTSRLVNVFQKILRIGPIQLIKADGSINDRIGHIYFSFKGFIDNFFLPHGFSNWGKYLAIEQPKQTYFWNITNLRIMSSYGSALFTMGFLGILLPFVYNRAITNLGYNKVKYLFIFFINIFYLTAIPISFPLFSFLLSLIIINSKKDISHVGYMP